jgi:3-oxoacyl-[acyl-carrier-protein] synthase II
MPEIRDAVVTGVGVVSPIGIGEDAFWDSLVRGASGIRQLDGALGQVPKLGFGGNLVDFDPKAHVRPRKALKVMCREIQTAFAAATLAFEAADLTSESLAADRIGTVFGSEMMSGEPEEVVDTMIDCGVSSGQPRESDFGESAMRKIYPLWMLKYLPNMSACHVGIMLGALGPNNTLLLGDTSAAAAMAESLSVLRRDLADVMITGAAGTRLSPSRIIFTGGLPQASRRDPVAASSRPMAKNRDGVVGAEAAAILVTESARSAKQRGVSPMAIVAGTASRYIPPSGNGREYSGRIDQAIKAATIAALEDANVSADQIGAVVSHAMGHGEIDAAEARVIEDLFGSQIPVTAPIGAIGHSGAAAGAIDLVIGTLILKHQLVPPTVNAKDKDPACKVNLLQHPAELKKPGVLVLSHTLQGGAMAVVLTRP